MNCLQLRSTLLLVLSIVLLAGCGGGGGGAGGGPAGTLQVLVNWPTRVTRAIPEAANSIVVRVRIGSYDQRQTTTRNPAGTPTSLTFSPPSGQVSVEAFAYPTADGAGTPLAMFNGPVHVTASQTTEIGLSLATTIVSLTVAPDPIAAVPGRTTQVTAYGRDADQNYVLLWPGEVTWQSFNPGVATVGGTGAPVTVTGVSAGTAQLQATDHESGLTATGTVTVQPPGLQRGTWAREGGDNRNTRRGVGNGATGTGGTFGIGLSGAPSLGLDGTIYGGRHDLNANFGDDDVSAFDIDSGSQRWTFRTLGPVTAAPAIGADGTIFAPSGDGELHALDQTGVERWHITISAPRAFLHSSPVVADDGTVYVGSSSAFHRVTAIDGYTGQIKWTFAVEGFVRSPALGSDGTLYFGCQDDQQSGVLYALQPSGSVKWAKDFAVDFGRTLGLAPPMIGDDGTVYIQDTDGRLYALDPANGGLRWSTAVNSTSYLALGTNGDIYATTTDAFYFYLTAINPQNGAVRWSHRLRRNNTGGMGVSPVVAGDGTVYADGEIGVEALDPGNGSLRWTQPIGSVLAVASDGRLICTASSGVAVHN